MQLTIEYRTENVELLSFFPFEIQYSLFCIRYFALKGYSFFLS